MKACQFETKTTTFQINRDGEVHQLKVNVITGDIKYYMGENLLGVTQTSEFDTSALMDTLDKYQFTQDEKTYLNYVMFINKLAKFFSECGQQAKTVFTDILILRNRIKCKEIVEFYSLIYGEDYWKVTDSLVAIDSSTEFLQASLSAGGFIAKDAKQVYLSNHTTLTMSSMGLTISRDKQFIDVRLYDNGDSHHTPCNPYHKLVCLEVTANIKIRTICKQLLNGLNIITYADMVESHGGWSQIDEEIYDSFTSEICSIMLK